MGGAESEWDVEGDRGSWGMVEARQLCYQNGRNIMWDFKFVFDIQNSIVTAYGFGERQTSMQHIIRARVPNGAMDGLYKVDD